MKGDITVRGIKAECLMHICQDDLYLDQFADNNGEQVWMGSVSDGCSGALGSENGSAFLVRTFAEEAERLGKDGKRDKNFLIQVALALLDRMAEYQPKDPGSEIRCYNGLNISDELCATFYGFIADKKKTFLLLAGNGFLAINGCGKVIEQTMGHDIYPVYLLRLPREKWENNLERVFTLAEFSSDRVNDLVLATDGYSHPRIDEYSGITKKPATFILHASYSATARNTEDFPGAYATRGHDDTSILSYARIGLSSSRNPISSKEVEKIRQQAKNSCTKDFWKDVESTKSSVMRPCLRKVNPMDDPNFKRDLPESEGIHLFGITEKDETEYEHLRNQIINSRAFDPDPLATMFAKKKVSATASVTPQPVKTARVMPLKTPVLAKVPVGLVSNQKPLVTMTLIDKNEPASPSSKQKPPAKQHQKHQKHEHRGRKTKPAEEWKPFQEICDYHLHRKHSIGFRYFGRVMYDLWHFIENCHNQGLRFGNLRPRDLQLKVCYEREPGRRFRKPVRYEFSLVKPETAAEVDAEKKLVRNYSKLDLNFVHPDYAGRMTTDDEARLDQDWYAFSVLCCWFVTKFDPFGAGKVIAKPEADRIYRMENILLSQSSDIEIDERWRLFIDRAIRRIGPKIEDFFGSSIEREDLNQSPDFLLEEFRDENIIICKAEIFKRDRSGKVRKTQCGFKQLKGFNTCGYCETAHVKMISASHQLYQTEEQAATV